MEKIIGEKRYKKLKSPMYGILNNEALPYNHDEYISDIFETQRARRLKILQGLNEKITENDRDLVDHMTSLLKEVKLYESNNEKLLVDVVEKYLVEKYDLDINEIELKSTIGKKLKFDGVEDDVILEFDDYESISNHSKSIKKRIIIESLIDGASRDYKDFLHETYNELSDIDPLLPMKYNRLGSMASYLPYTEKGDKLVDGGQFEIKYPENAKGKITIICNAIDGLSLFSNLNKAILTLLANNSLQSDYDKDITIIKESRKNKADIFIGDKIWESFKRSMNKINDKYLPYLIYEISLLPTEEFNSLMKEILCDTKKSKIIINEISDKIIYNLKR